MTCPPEILFNGAHLLAALFIAFAFFRLGVIRERKAEEVSSYLEDVDEIIERERESEWKRFMRRDVLCVAARPFMDEG